MFFYDESKTPDPAQRENPGALPKKGREFMEGQKKERGGS
jgi:hypothetical protein